MMQTCGTTDSTSVFQVYPFRLKEKQVIQASWPEKAPETLFPEEECHWNSVPKISRVVFNAKGVNQIVHYTKEIQRKSHRGRKGDKEE